MAIKMTEKEWDKISQKMAKSLAGLGPDLTPNESELLRKKSKIQKL